MNVNESVKTLKHPKSYLGNPKLASLEKCFFSVVKGRQVNLDLPVVKYLLSAGFNFDLTAIENTLAEILPYIFIYHVNHWPGWQKFGEFKSGKLTLDAWFKSFCIYLHSKLMVAAKIDCKQVLEEMETKKEVNIENKATQTSNPVVKPVGPFTIEIKCEAAHLNTFKFSVLNDLDLELTQHEAYPWTPHNIDVKTILSWPHVEVKFISPILKFERCVQHDFQRFLSSYEDKLSFPTERDQALASKSSSSTKTTHYSLNFIEGITNELLKALKAAYSHDIELLVVIQTLLDEFVADIKELTEKNLENKDAIPSKFSSTFHIGKSIYYRNKVCLTPTPSTNSDVMFYEIITPKIELRLSALDPSKVKSYLESIRKSRKSVGRPIVRLKCSYCQVTYEKSFNSLINHFFEKHTMESPMTCPDCGGVFLADRLARSRWNHNCTGQK